MTEPRVTKAVLDWIYSTQFETFTPAVTRSAKFAIYDAIGGMMACSLLPVAHRMADCLKIIGGAPDCSMIGFPSRTSVLNAAMFNGTLGHADEVDAVEWDFLGRHILATCTGTAISAGQLVGASGRDVIRAIVLGREFTKRINAVAVQQKRDTGIDRGHIDASNTMGAVVAAGVALKLKPEQMDVAFTLAAMMAGGFPAHTRETQHMAKSFIRGGAGAKNAIIAALMAKVDYDAPRNIFDAPQGFFQIRLGLEQPGPEFLTGRDQDFGLEQLVMKRYAAGSPNLAPKQALLDLMAEHKLAATDIEEIVAEVQTEFMALLGVSYPTFDGKGMLAIAALHGGVGFREVYQAGIYNSPKAIALRERVKVQAREDWKGHKFNLHAAVTVTTKDGRKLRNETTYRRMTEAEVDSKFSHLVGLRAGTAKAEKLAQMLKGLDDVNNVADVMTQMELPAATIDEI